MKFLFKLLLILSSVFGLTAENYTISTIKDVMNHLRADRKQIVIFDIDNTLLRAPSHLGSDQWVSCIAKQNMASGMSHREAWDQILPTYFHIQNYIDLVPTEADIVASVTAIEQACDHTICLTARSPIYLAAITCIQLAKNCLNFKVPEVNLAKLNLPGDSIYQEGVVFCGHNCKGEALLNFLQACNYVPDEIIFIDDKLYNLEAVEQQLADSGIAFTGLRYAGCDHLIAALDVSQAQQDLDQLLLQYPLN